MDFESFPICISKSHLIARICSELKFRVYQTILSVQYKFDMSTVASFRDITQWLYRIRQPLANYQELKGLPKDEIFGFLSLLTTLCQHSYNAFVVIFAMLYNLSPMVDSILYLLRFLLDKIIDIGESEDMNEKLNKLLIFLGQLLVLSMVMFMISTLLIIPIFNLIGSIFSCTWGWMGLHYV